MKEFDIFKNPYQEEYEEITEAVKLNDNYCPCMIDKNEDTKCMCKDFRLRDSEGLCACGRYEKRLRDEDDFINMRIASMKRGKKG